MADAMEKLEAAVKKLAADMAELRGGQAELREGQAELRADVDELKGGQVELLGLVKGIQRTQTALTEVVTKAVKELSTSKTLELRLRRLEDAVFGSKH